MNTIVLTCIICPNGCELNIERDQNGLHITGEMCNRGVIWARQEVTFPQRTVTSNILVKNGDWPLISVRTDGAISVNKINEVMYNIKRTVVSAPVAIGDILIENVGETGVSVVATREVKEKP